MKKFSFTVATLAALLFSANTFAGDDNNPKNGPANETEITLATPNDDPNAPPPPTVTYYMVAWNGTEMTTEEKNYFSVLYNSTLTDTKSYSGTGKWPGTNILTPYKFMPIGSAECQTWFMNNSSCTGCRIGSALFNVSSPVTSSASIFVYGGCPL